jgi:hypothetical protein
MIYGCVCEAVPEEMNIGVSRLNKDLPSSLWAPSHPLRACVEQKGRRMMNLLFA